MLLNLICEETTKKGMSVNLTSVFTFIGMAFCIIASIVALVWLTCFIVKLLIKTFKVQVQNSYEVFVENNTAKAKSKKERNAIKRKADDARKLEILNMKLESQERIHNMKKDKLEKAIFETEEKAREKYGYTGSASEEKPANRKNETAKKSHEEAKTKNVSPETTETDEELESSHINEKMEVQEESNLETETLVEEPVEEIADNSSSEEHLKQSNKKK